MSSTILMFIAGFSSGVLMCFIGSLIVIRHDSKQWKIEVHSKCGFDGANSHARIMVTNGRNNIVSCEIPGDAIDFDEQLAQGMAIARQKMISLNAADRLDLGSGKR